MLVMYNAVRLMIICLMVDQLIAISFNRPKLCANATWNPNGTTIANSSIVGIYPYGVFVNTNNTVFAAAQSLNQVQVWLEGDTNPTRTITGNLTAPMALFVAVNGDLYVDNGVNGRVDKWSANTNDSVSVMNVSAQCLGLFIDNSNSLYCSMYATTQVVKMTLGGNGVTTAVVAGNGTIGSTPEMLNHPHGIFVDEQCNLYVADTDNQRIQKFLPGQRNGTTLAGGGIGGIWLSYPIQIVLDADGYLFITEYLNNKISGQGPNGFRCIVGCFGGGSTSYQLNHPQTLSFDSYGNIYVIDRENNRLQKFFLTTDSCDITTTSEPLKTSTIAAEIPTTCVQPTDLSTTALSSIVATSDLSTENTHVSSTDFSATTDEMTTMKKPLSDFVPPTCPNSTRIGIHCNISNSLCNMLHPCQNSGSCINRNGSYLCICSPGFNGTQCQFDHRPCQPNTCWSNGTCAEVTNTTFNCICAFGWSGIYCETKINYCANVTCLNRGVCYLLVSDYKCECLGDSFSGRHCEITSNRVVVHRIISKSFASIAISAGLTVMAFVVIMDILKYCFGIDPRREELERVRREKRTKTVKRPVVVRYTYVHTSATSEQQISVIKSTTV